MKNNSVLIIGAGIGGLAVGIRLAAEGFRGRIVEKGMEAGGWLRPVRIGDITFPNAVALMENHAPIRAHRTPLHRIL